MVFMNYSDYYKKYLTVRKQVSTLNVLFLSRSRGTEDIRIYGPFDRTIFFQLLKRYQLFFSAEKFPKDAGHMQNRTKWTI